ncbi:MAG: zinc-ribbon domain-containing protein [Lewinellaceae bacterium]|nr:zinc-ribbon domain-containing protein [Lewinellaceae bacterium]
MFCPSCGTQNNDDAAFCSNCGTVLKQSGQQQPSFNPPIQNMSNQPMSPADDPGADTILKVVSFCVPLVGIILYFVWSKERPKSAKDVCTFAAIGFGVGILFYIIMIVFAAVAGSSMDTY